MVENPACVSSIIVRSIEGARAIELGWTSNYKEIVLGTYQQNT
jgi:hypothetical protein